MFHLNNRRITIISLLLTALVVSSVIAVVQHSTNFAILWDVLDEAGDTGSSTNFNLTDSIGQPSPIGELKSANYMIYGGFQAYTEEECQLIGDVSGNGEITAYDAALILQGVVGILSGKSCPCYNLDIADVTGDGTISALDAAFVLQYTVGLIDQFPKQMGAAPAIAHSKSANVSIAKVNKQSGNQITVQIYVDDAEELLSGEFVLGYDANVLTPTKVYATSLTEEATLFHKVRPGQITVALANAHLLSETNPLLNIDFNVQTEQQFWEHSKAFTLLQVRLNENSHVAVVNSDIEIPPYHTALLNNYPNPFNPETWLPYQLAQDANVTISIHNIKGQLIRALHLGNQRAGVYVVKDKAAYWDGKDSLGQDVSSGVYFYTLQANDFTATRKMVIMK